MEKLVIAIIAMMALMINANAQNKIEHHLGLGFSGQALIGIENLSARFHASYEMSVCQLFAVEAAAYYGYQQTNTEKTFRYDDRQEWFYDHSFMPVLGVDVYGKVNIKNFQILGGGGYLYAWPSKMESLQPEEGCVATVATYGRMASGFKASIGLGYTLFSNARTGERLNMKALCSLIPFNNSGQIAREVGIEVGVTYYISLK